MTLKRVVISAGELSGDEHAARLLKALLSLQPDLLVRAMGGRNLRAAGAEIVVDSEKTASTMGFAELFGQLGTIFKSFSAMKRLLREWRPDVLVLVDYPDFNLRLARYAKSLGIKTFYFIIPKMWAWRSGRIEQFKRFVDHAALIFPFEKQFCVDHGYHRATYVGHPFATEFQDLPAVDRTKFISELGLDPAAPVLAILPGSRKGEIFRFIKVILEAFRIFKLNHPNVQGIIPIPGSVEPEWIEPLLPSDGSIKVTHGNALTVMRVADAGLIKSGTSNLQAAFCDLPFVMFYSSTASTAWIVRRFVNLKEYSIVNVIRPHTVVEIIQEEVTPERIARELECVLNDDARRQQQRHWLGEVRQSLTEPNTEITSGNSAYERAALLIRD